MIVNLPWAKGDRFYIEGAYSEGAPAYAGWSGGMQGGYAQLRPLQRPHRRGGLGVRLDLRQPAGDRPDRSSADHVVDDRRGHRALLDPGFPFVAVW